MRFKKLNHEGEKTSHLLRAMRHLSLFHCRHQREAALLRIFKKCDELPVSGRHIFAHLVEILEVDVVREVNAEKRIKRGEDGALRAGFTVKLLRHLPEASFVDDAVWQCGVVL